MVFLSRPSLKALATRCRCRVSCLVLLTCPTIAPAFRYFPPTPTNLANHTRPQSNQNHPPTRLVPGLKHWNWPYVVTMEYKDHPEPLIRTSSPAPLAHDFARQQVSKQQRSNYHSSSISSRVTSTMVSQSVNKTGLHPAGVQ